MARFEDTFPPYEAFGILELDDAHGEGVDTGAHQNDAVCDDAAVNSAAHCPIASTSQRGSSGATHE